jgi:hypothetical protein
MCVGEQWFPPHGLVYVLMLIYIYIYIYGSFFSSSV